MSAGAEAWAKGLETWGKMLGGVDRGRAGRPSARTAASPRRNGATTRSSTPSARPICAISDKLLGTVEEIDGLDEAMREKLRFATKQLRRCDEPVELRADQPAGAEADDRDARRESAQGPRNMLNDIAAGQLTQTKPGAFEVGRNLATTPGKVVKQTPLYQLIQYTPTTDEVLKTPLVIFPPWINRFYILDLTPEKSFVKWCVDQGITPVHGQLEIGRREHRRRYPRRLCAEGPDRRDRHGPRPARRRRRPRHRLLRRRHHAGRDARLPPGQEARRTRSSPRPSSPRRSISAKPATSSCSPATRRWRCSTR